MGTIGCRGPFCLGSEVKIKKKSELESRLGGGKKDMRNEGEKIKGWNRRGVKLMLQHGGLYLELHVAC